MANTVLILERNEAEALVRSYKFTNNGELLTSLPPFDFGDDSTNMLPMDCDILAMCFSARFHRVDTYPFYGGFSGQYYTVVAVVGEVTIQKAIAVAHRALLELYKDLIIDLGLLETLKSKEANRLLDHARETPAKLSVVAWAESLWNARTQAVAAEHLVITNILQSKLAILPPDTVVIPPICNYAEKNHALRLVPVSLPKGVKMLSPRKPAVNSPYEVLCGSLSTPGQIINGEAPSCLLGDSRNLISVNKGEGSDLIVAPSCHLSVASSLDSLLSNKGNIALLNKVSKLYSRAYVNLLSSASTTKRGYNRDSMERAVKKFVSSDEVYSSEAYPNTVLGMWETYKTELLSILNSYHLVDNNMLHGFIERLGIASYLAAMDYFGISRNTSLNMLHQFLSAKLAETSSYEKYLEYQLVLGAL